MWYRCVPCFNFSSMTSCVLARKKRVALTCRRNLQIFFPSAPALPPSFPPLPFRFSSILSLSRSPRAIHQRKSTGVLAFPFFGCSNGLVVSLVNSPFPYFSFRFSFRLCPSFCNDLLTFPSS